MLGPRAGLSVSVLAVVLTTCTNPADDVSGNWKGTTAPTNNPTFAVTWTMTLSPAVYDVVTGEGGCTYNTDGSDGGRFFLTGEFDGSHLTLSGGGLASHLILDATVSGNSLSGTYTGTAERPCFLYSGTWQGTRQ